MRICGRGGLIFFLTFVIVSTCWKGSGIHTAAAVVSPSLNGGNSEVSSSSPQKILISYLSIVRRSLFIKPLVFLRNLLSDVIRWSSNLILKLHLFHVSAAANNDLIDEKEGKNDNSLAKENLIVAVTVPIIDIGPLISADAKREDVLSVAKQIGKACEEVGFFIIRGHGVDDHIINEAWRTTREFFDLPLDEKLMYVKPQHENPFGYSKLGGEVLSVGKAAQNNVTASSSQKSENAPDLKELFSLGPSNPDAGFPPRLFPERPLEFEDAWTTYYSTMEKLASKLMMAFAIALKLPDDNFFENFTTHHASAMRALNYPHMENYIPVPGQLRASAHTDYGALTILRSDSPGLQVSKDKHPPSWHNVLFIKDGFVVNLGDLMQRWTNDVWLSTLHRVVNPQEVDAELVQDFTRAGAVASSTESTRRQSIAFFYNMNRDALIEVLNSKVPKYEPVKAGDFLMQKHLASVGEKV
jgi:isopenicillin N synthase-like dioxygenase